MFAPRRNQNMIEAAGSTLALIYYQTVYNLRTDHRNAIVGLLITIVQSALFMVAFLIFYLIMGVRTSPIRGDFIVFLLTGIFAFMLHARCVGAVAGAYSIANGVGRHTPLNPLILVAGAALATLYRQAISGLALFTFYYALVAPIPVENWTGFLGILLLSWFSGGCIGLVFLAIRPWWPKATPILSNIWQRINMVASGKMFVANVIPGFILPWFIWNPLFHLVDQARGFVFINYTPLRTSALYPLKVSIAVMLVALILNFATRRAESLSWSAGQ